MKDPLNIEKPLDAPKLYLGVCEIYEFLYDHATWDEEDPDMLVWEGHLTLALEQKLGVTPNRYGRNMKCLQDMGCVEQLRRGAGSTVLSKWALIGKPTPEGFEYVRSTQNKRRYKMDLTRNSVKTHAIKIADLESRLRALENMMGVHN